MSDLSPEPPQWCPAMGDNFPPLPAGEARPTTEARERASASLDKLRAANDAMADFIGKSPSPPPEVEQAKAAMLRQFSIDRHSLIGRFDAETYESVDALIATVRAEQSHALAVMSACHEGERKTWSHDRQTLGSALAAQAQEVAEAMAVLAPNMPESGLVDACRQVKQVAISEADNANHLEKRVAALGQEIERLKAAIEDRTIERNRAELRTEAAEAKLSQIPLLEDQSILDYHRDASSYNEGRMDMMAQIRASLLPPPDKGTL